MSVLVELFLSLVRKFQWSTLFALLVALAAVLGPYASGWLAAHPDVLNPLGALAAILAAVLPPVVKKA